MSEKKQLERKEIEAILESINHEIRTPLNAITGFSNIIAESAESAEGKKYAAIIRANNERLLQMVEAMMGLTKLMTGTLDFTKSGTDLNLLLEKLATIMCALDPDGEIQDPSQPCFEEMSCFGRLRTFDAGFETVYLLHQKVYRQRRT